MIGKLPAARVGDPTTHVACVGPILGRREPSPAQAVHRDDRRLTQRCAAGISPPSRRTARAVPATAPDGRFLILADVRAERADEVITGILHCPNPHCSRNTRSSTASR